MSPAAQVPASVGVYGGGRMGAGIAHAFLLAGARVSVVESSEEAAQAARERVHKTLGTAQQRGVVTEAELGDAIGRLTVGCGAATVRECALVVEAVPEDVELKSRILAEVEAEVASDAWLATNTSSLSIDQIAGALQRPERFIGLHFFNPVPASQLVEIVVGTATDQDYVARARSWVEALDKTPITVADAPGFASSRLGVMLALEAMRMVESGVASAEDIDTAMTLGYKHPMGPLRTTDVVGLDVRLAIAEHLASQFGERFEPPAILRDLVAAGHLGRKTGRGFFDWS